MTTIWALDRGFWVRAAASALPLTIFVTIAWMWLLPQGFDFTVGLTSRLLPPPVVGAFALFLQLLFWYQGRAKENVWLLGSALVLLSTFLLGTDLLQPLFLESTPLTLRAGVAVVASYPVAFCTYVPLAGIRIDRQGLRSMLLSEGSGFWDHPGIISSAYIAAIGLHWSFYFLHGQPLLIHVTTPLSEFLINLLGQLVYAVLPQLFTAFVLPSLLLARLTARAIPKLLRCLIYSAVFLAVSYLTEAVYPIYMFLFGLIFAWLFVETRTVVWSFILYVMLKVFAG